MAARGVELPPPHAPGPLEPAAQVGLGHVCVEDAGKRAPRHEREALQEVHDTVAGREPLARPAAQHRTLAVRGIDQLEVVVDDVAHRRGLYDAQARHVAGQAPAKEVARTHGPQQERVVVEEHEALGQALDAGDVQLDGVRIEGRQVGRGDVVRMIDHMQARIRGVEPRGQVAPRDEVDAPYPGCQPLDAAEPVTQVAPVAEPDLRGVGPLGAAHGEELTPPCGVFAIDPRNHEVDRSVVVLFHSRIIGSTDCSPGCRHGRCAPPP